MICSTPSIRLIHCRRSLHDMAIVVTLLCISAVAGWIVAYQLLLQNGRMMARVKRLEQQLDAGGAQPHDPFVTGLPAGSLLNDFELPALSGGTRTLSSWRGRRLLLLFFSPTCPFCLRMLSDFASLEPSSDPHRPLAVIISTGDAGENRRLFERHGVRLPVLVQEDAELASLYRINGTPMGYLVDEHGATESALLTGAAPLLDAVRLIPTDRGAQTSKSLATSRLVRDGLKKGTQAPAFSLPSLDGGTLRLESYRGTPVLLVFSDPGCGPCMELAPKLQEVHATAQDLRILMISRGELEVNREKVSQYGLSFSIGLQRHWEISREYGMFATPIGYLIDREGVLASDVAVGADAIMKLSDCVERTERVTPHVTTVGL
jgi:peroxiredoxin